VPESLFDAAHARMLSAKFPAVQLMEAVSQQAVVHVLAKSIEQARPVDSRLVRVHDCLWLRLWRRPQMGPMPEPGSIQDLICSVGAH
jgi:hypothetical protein